MLSRSSRRMALVLLVAAAPVLSQSFDSKLFAEMRWREIGPYRGGRTRALSGVPSQPNIFYIGAVNGGVWKTTDYGRTWNPIFDHEPTGSIGTIAVAPSDPKVVYVGSGEGLQRPDLSTGDGIYRSTDAGGTWTHLGLRDGQQIPKIAVDPRNPKRLFVAVLGHPYGPNQERGIYRSTDGGETFEKVLYKGENTGGNDVELDPENPDVIYGCLWEAREGPWENAAWTGVSGGIFKSTDGGNTWRQLTRGLPAVGIVQANLAVAPSDPKRIYATVAAPHALGIYRSDDAGQSWTEITKDPRPAARIGGGDLPLPAVDPKNPDIVYSASIVAWKSIDGGRTWTGIRGAPGGDDYQNIWINPGNPAVILMVSDQGAIVTVNGGETWSSWFNQPTAQMYHVSTDSSFPYRVCGGQQESGSACVSSRSNDGEITLRDWHPVGVEEYGYVAPDPLDPDLIYGGKVTRYDRRTGQTANIGPKPLRPGGYRVLRTAPVVFSPLDPHVLYFAANTVWKTRDGGATWQQISPDLTRRSWEMPASVGKYRGSETAKVTQRGVVYALAPSALDEGLIWAGTDDGLIQVTTDGGRHWRDITPAQLTAWEKVSIIDASHFSAETAYAAVNSFRLDDLRPHIYRTHDDGKTWTEIVNGIPAGAAVNVVREDPKRRGLLYAGTEREVYVSFDDGNHWQSLRLNMPATSIRDLTMKDDDVVAATHGRGFWILDDITPLRQMSASAIESRVYLFKPQAALRVRWDTNTDTPIPPDEPAGENPPDGAIIDYYLGPASSGPVSLEILDKAGKVVRRFASTNTPAPLDPMLAIPKYWLRPSQTLSSDPGMHRFLWDMHYTPLAETSRREYPMQAVVHNTPLSPTSPWVMPGEYTVRLTEGGKAYTQPLAMKMDPRVKTPAAGLLEQFTLSMGIYEDLRASLAAAGQLRALRTQLTERKAKSETPAGAAIAAFDAKAAALEGPSEGHRGGRAAESGPDTLNGVNEQLSAVMRDLQEADVTPTSQMVEATADRRRALAGLMSRWNTLIKQDLPTLNAQLGQAGLPPVTVPAR